MTAVRTLVSVVDDDEYVREALPDLLRSFGLEARSFPSAEEFLSSDSLRCTGCLVLDVTMPGMSGLELYDELLRQRHNIPVVFISANYNDDHWDEVLRRSAVAYLAKPFTDAALIEAVNAALERGDGA